MIGVPPIWLAAGALIIGAAAGYAVAAKVGAAETARAEARRIECEHARAEDARAAAEKTAALLARAQDAEQDAARALSARQAATQTRLRETRDHVDTLTTGRECLPAAVRLRLNAAIAATGDVPATAGDTPDAAAAAATDTGVAGWILDAVEHYEACRARIDALRAWDEGVSHGG